MNRAVLLNRFKTESVATASPVKLLTMLYDRLVIDLDRGIAALAAGDRGAANEQFTHAQQIIHELRASLDVEAWEGGRALGDLYGYLLREIVGANVARDAARAATCRDLIVPLRDAWHEAAASLSATAASPDGAGVAGQPAGDLGVA